MKRTTPLRRSTRVLARRRRRFSPDAWAALREQLWREQGGRCLSCRRPVPLSGSVRERLHAAHVRPLGMGRSRHDADNELNQRGNVIGLCWSCHAVFDATPLPSRIALAEVLGDRG